MCEISPVMILGPGVFLSRGCPGGVEIANVIMIIN